MNYKIKLVLLWIAFNETETALNAYSGPLALTKQRSLKLGNYFSKYIAHNFLASFSIKRFFCQKDQEEPQTQKALRAHAIAAARLPIDTLLEYANSKISYSPDPQAREHLLKWYNPKVISLAKNKEPLLAKKIFNRVVAQSQNNQDAIVCILQKLDDAHCLSKQDKNDFFNAIRYKRGTPTIAQFFIENSRHCVVYHRLFWQDLLRSLNSNDPQKLTEFLIKKIDNKGNTLLHCAIQQKKYSLISWILAQHSDLKNILFNHKNNKGFTPLDLVRKKYPLNSFKDYPKNEDILNFLLQNKPFDYQSTCLDRDFSHIELTKIIHFWIFNNKSEDFKKPLPLTSHCLAAENKDVVIPKKDDRFVPFAENFLQKISENKVEEKIIQEPLEEKQKEGTLSTPFANKILQDMLNAEKRKKESPQTSTHSTEINPMSFVCFAPSPPCSRREQAQLPQSSAYYETLWESLMQHYEAKKFDTLMHLIENNPGVITLRDKNNNNLLHLLVKEERGYEILQLVAIPYHNTLSDQQNQNFSNLFFQENNEGKTPLMITCEQNNNLLIVSHLIGILLNKKTRQGINKDRALLHAKNALDYAIEQKKWDIVGVLIERGVDIAPHHEQLKQFIATESKVLTDTQKKLLGRAIKHNLKQKQKLLNQSLSSTDQEFLDNATDQVMFGSAIKIIADDART